MDEAIPYGWTQDEEHAVDEILQLLSLDLNYLTVSLPRAKTNPEVVKSAFRKMAMTQIKRKCEAKG